MTRNHSITGRFLQKYSSFQKLIYHKINFSLSIHKILIFLLLTTITIHANAAVRCFATGIKTNCWDNYNVTINVLDSKNNNKVATIIIPVGSSWARQEFNCTPGQTLKFESVFNPSFWEKEKDRVYKGLNHWSLPKVVTPNDKAWNLNICFASQFAQVPMPPEAGQKCVCDMSVVEKIKID